MSGPPPTGARGIAGPRKLAIELEEFGWEALQREATAMKVSEEQLVAFAVMYYLADLDSGRIARRLPPAHLSDPSPP